MRRKRDEKVDTTSAPYIDAVGAPPPRRWGQVRVERNIYRRVPDNTLTLRTNRKHISLGKMSLEQARRVRSEVLARCACTKLLGVPDAPEAFEPNQYATVAASARMFWRSKKEILALAACGAIKRYELIGAPRQGGGTGRKFDIYRLAEIEEALRQS